MFTPSVTGQWVDENFQRLAEILMDYDPYLQLQWIPYDQRSGEDSRPYRIVDTRSNYVVMHASETDNPQAILAKIFAGDNKHGNVLQRLDAANAAKEAFELKEKMDLMEELNDQAAWLIATKKNYIKFNGKKLDDQLRPLD